jgi:ABC-2 type transport system permease protein
VLLRDVFTKSIWDARRSWLGWTVAIVAVGSMYGAFWPTIQTPEMGKALEAYPSGLLEAFNYNDLTSVEGFLGSAVYGLLIPLLVAIFMINAGTRAVAGDEEAGTLDLLLAHPVSRTRLAVQRFAAMLVGVLLIGAALCLAMIALSGPVGFDGVSAGEFAAINLQLALFGAVFGALAFAVGAATGRKGLTLGVSAGVAVLTYLANSVLPQVEGLGWTRNLSPFHWYLGGDPLTNGLDVGGALLLAGVTVALVAIGTGLFRRRDLAT